MRTRLLLSLLFMAGVCVGQTYTYSTLAGFPATSKKGPFSPQYLIIDSAGNLYGMSSGGGAFGFGTVYKATPKGALTVLHSFNSTDGNPDGSSIFPFAYANLTRDSKGNIYGAAPLGGVLDTNCPAAGCGTVFKLTAGKTGTYTFSMLYSGPEGQYPQGVTLDSNGNLYVLGSNGGIEEFNGCCFGAGELFELSPSGLYSDLYDFDLSNGFDGAAPIGSLVATSSGVFYGITNLGGFVYNIDGAEGFSAGLVFEWSQQLGWSGPVHNFTDTQDNGFGVPDGAYPSAKLTQDKNGNLYGTTMSGGTTGYGTVFKIGTGSAYSLLYNFCQQANCTDGSYPVGPIILDASGNLYGTTPTGGVSGHGVVFKITSAGAYSVIYNGGPAGVGRAPVVDKTGNLYGTTPTGGPSHNGSIYKLTKNK
jgi:uncharacterized repeat protein (TIGR03803 family)